MVGMELGNLAGDKEDEHNGVGVVVMFITHLLCRAILPFETVPLNRV